MGYTPDLNGGNKNWFQRLTEKIPGISGYQAKEGRRDVDKMFRDALADRIRLTKTPVANVVRDLSEGGRLFEVTPLERISKKIDTIENRIRFATYGYAGFFDVAQIKEDQLDQIYQFDLGLVEHVEAIEAQANALGGNSGTKDSLKAAATLLEQAVDALSQKFEMRHQAINGFSGATAPGRPMFS